MGRLKNLFRTEEYQTTFSILKDLKKGFEDKNFLGNLTYGDAKRTLNIIQTLEMQALENPKLLGGIRTLKTNLKDAISNYKTKLESFSTIDMANPNARANMGNAYNNMMLQAKEAYNLGVLNGPDYQILQSVVKDPTSAGALFVSKKALNEQASDLAKQADIIIGNVYKTHQRQVPTNMQPQGNVQVTSGTPSKVVNFNDLK